MTCWRKRNEQDYSGLGITGVVFLALIVCSFPRLLNRVICRLGSIGVMAAILALAYSGLSVVEMDTVKGIRERGNRYGKDGKDPSG